MSTKRDRKESERTAGLRRLIRDILRDAALRPMTPAEAEAAYEAAEPVPLSEAEIERIMAGVRSAIAKEDGKHG